MSGETTKQFEFGRTWHRPIATAEGCGDWTASRTPFGANQLNGSGSSAIMRWPLAGQMAVARCWSQTTARPQG